MRRIYLWSIILFLLLCNLVTLYLLLNNNNNSPSPYITDNYRLLSPQIAWMNVDDFLEVQKSMTVSYTPLKEELRTLIFMMDYTDEYGVYFEDLTTGSWIGINERKEFYPHSLLKVPVLVAVLKKIQDKEITLDDRLIVKPVYVDQKSGSLYLKGAGYNPTIKELLQYLIKESDNTAVMTLVNELLTMDDITAANMALGLSVQDSVNPEPLLSTKDYSNVFRSLYYSTYLRRTFSELALVLMMNTDYSSQIPAGVPEGTRVAHKIGFYIEEGYFHDCGIVYYEPSPYLLCVMTGDLTSEEADKFISTISRTVYKYVSEKNTTVTN